VIEKLTRGDALMVLVITKSKDFIGNEKIKGSFDCSNHEIVEFRILRAKRRGKRKITESHRITESQNVQGWKGPLWII